MKFYGGVLDGKEFEVALPILRVPVRELEGVMEWVNPPNHVVMEWQEYELRNGDYYRIK